MAENEQRALYRITDMELSERPRERLAQKGPGVLKVAELLAILLGTGIKGENAVQMGERLLHNLGGIAGIHRASFDVVCAERGIGPAKAAQIKAAIELGIRLVRDEPETRRIIQNPGDAADLVRYEMGALEQEELRVILLDTRNRVLRIDPVCKGSLNSSHVMIGGLFRAAIRGNAAAVIVVHNHPSGDPAPSPDDVTITRAIIQAGRILDIDVLDHLIIGQGSFVSLKERKMGFG
jgi:DNA repair protein RadC